MNYIEFASAHGFNIKVYEITIRDVIRTNVALTECLTTVIPRLQSAVESYAESMARQYMDNEGNSHVVSVGGCEIYYPIKLAKVIDYIDWVEMVKLPSSNK